jgi:hypothetical protein
MSDHVDIFNQEQIVAALAALAALLENLLLVAKPVEE